MVGHTPLQSSCLLILALRILSKTLFFIEWIIPARLRQTFSPDVFPNQAGRRIIDNRVHQARFAVINIFRYFVKLSDKWML